MCFKRKPGISSILSLCGFVLTNLEYSYANSSIRVKPRSSKSLRERTTSSSVLYSGICGRRIQICLGWTLFSQHLQIAYHDTVRRLGVFFIDIRIHILDIYDPFINIINQDPERSPDPVKRSLDSLFPSRICKPAYFMDKRSLKEWLSAAEHDTPSDHSEIDIIFLQNLDQSFRSIVPAYVRKRCFLIVNVKVSDRSGNSVSAKLVYARNRNNKKVGMLCVHRYEVFSGGYSSDFYHSVGGYADIDITPH